MLFGLHISIQSFYKLPWAAIAKAVETANAVQELDEVDSVAPSEMASLLPAEMTLLRDKRPRVSHDMR